MTEQIFIGVLIADAVAFVILMLLAYSKDFLTLCARWDDPEWAKWHDEHEADFLRLKQAGSRYHG